MEMVPTVADPQRVQLTLCSQNIIPLYLPHPSASRKLSPYRDPSSSFTCHTRTAPISSIHFVALVGVPYHSLTHTEVIALTWGGGGLFDLYVVLGNHQTGCDFNQTIIRGCADVTRLGIRVYFHVCVIRNMLGALSDSFGKHVSFNR